MATRTRFAKITGVGACLPGAPVSNEELIARYGLNSTSDWIVERTGIRARHLAGPDQHSSDLGASAAHEAMAMAGRGASEIDLIIVATSTPDFVFPSVAALIQARLGIENGCPAFDVQAVCSGFVYALTIAEKMVVSGQYTCALVIGSEVFSRLLDWSDRRTCVLFGDGAGAVVVEASDQPGIYATTLHADGKQSAILAVPGRLAGGSSVGDPFLRMDGQAVFKLAVRVLAEACDEVLGSSGLTAQDVDYLIPHQANLRIIASTAKRLGVEDGQTARTVIAHGNTSAASIPLALHDAYVKKRIGAGSRVLVAGVGGGFTWGAAIFCL